MNTAVVISDTHCRLEGLEKIAPLFAENDFVIHLGDGFRDVLRFVRDVPGQPKKVYLCRGNCDLGYAEEEFVFTLGEVRLFCCHGHRYGVKKDREGLAARARELGCTAALYGHTHCAAIETVGGVLCINPGSLGDFVRPSYAYLAADRKTLVPTIVSV